MVIKSKYNLQKIILFYSLCMTLLSVLGEVRGDDTVESELIQPQENLSSAVKTTLGELLSKIAEKSSEEIQQIVILPRKTRYVYANPKPFGEHKIITDYSTQIAEEIRNQSYRLNLDKISKDKKIIMSLSPPKVENSLLSVFAEYYVDDSLYFDDKGEFYLVEIKLYSESPHSEFAATHYRLPKKEKQNLDFEDKKPPKILSAKILNGKSGSDRKLSVRIQVQDNTGLVGIILGEREYSDLGGSFFSSADKEDVLEGIKQSMANGNYHTIDPQKFRVPTDADAGNGDSIYENTLDFVLDEEEKHSITDDLSPREGRKTIHLYAIDGGYNATHLKLAYTYRATKPEIESIELVRNSGTEIHPIATDTLIQISIQAKDDNRLMGYRISDSPSEPDDDPDNWESFGSGKNSTATVTAEKKLRDDEVTIHKNQEDDYPYYAWVIDDESKISDRKEISFDLYTSSDFEPVFAFGKRLVENTSRVNMVLGVNYGQFSGNHIFENAHHFADNDPFDSPISNLSGFDLFYEYYFTRNIGIGFAGGDRSSGENATKTASGQLLNQVLAFNYSGLKLMFWHPLNGVVPGISFEAGNAVANYSEQLINPVSTEEEIMGSGSYQSAQLNFDFGEKDLGFRIEAKIKNYSIKWNSRSAGLNNSQMYWDDENLPTEFSTVNYQATVRYAF